MIFSLKLQKLSPDPSPSSKKIPRKSTKSPYFVLFRQGQNLYFLRKNTFLTRDPTKKILLFNASQPLAQCVRHGGHRSHGQRGGPALCAAVLDIMHGRRPAAFAQRGARITVVVRPGVAAARWPTEAAGSPTEEPSILVAE